MAVPVLESGHVTTSGTGTSVDITAPSSIAVGDLLIIVVNHDLVDEAYTFPTGFTELFTGGLRFEHALAYKIADSGDTSASDFTVSWSNNDTYTASMFRVSGVDTTTPINAYDTDSPATYGAYKSPSVTTTVDDCLVVVGWGSDDAKDQIAPSGTTLAYEVIVDEPHAVAYFTQSTAGATGFKGWDSGTAALPWTVAIAPSAGGGAIEQTVNLVTETATVLDLSLTQSQTVGLITESETVLQPSAEKSAVTNLVTETDLLFALSAEKSGTVDLVSESSTVLQVQAEKSAIVDQVVDTETILALSGVSTQTVDLVSESEIVLQAQAEKQQTVSLVAETETVLQVYAEIAQAVGLVSELNTVINLVGINSQVVDLVLDSSTILAASAEKSGTTDLVTETNTVQPATIERLQTVDLVTESALVNPLALDLSQTVSLVEESNYIYALDGQIPGANINLQFDWQIHKKALLFTPRNRELDLYD
jgi:hypothetical protein